MIEPLKDCYLRACALDVEAFKPGNVGRHGEGHDMTVADFLLSADVSAPPLCQPGLTLGERIYQAVAATSAAVGCNTNLGIILLAAPLLHGALRADLTGDLPGRVRQVLAETTVADADWTFKAIALAHPGGLGERDEHDVRQPAQVNLYQAMALAAGRDRIAWQYVNAFKDIFEFGVLRYNSLVNGLGFCDWAAAGVYTGFLSRIPDSHVQRKFGHRLDTELAERFLELDRELMTTQKPSLLAPKFQKLDDYLKARGINPGTSADLTVASVLAALLSTLVTPGKQYCN